MISEHTALLLIRSYKKLVRADCQHAFLFGPADQANVRPR